jgi:hypothetical protein
MDLFTTSTAKVVSKLGLALRCNVKENRRAKPVKQFTISNETTDEESFSEQKRVSR